MKRFFVLCGIRMFFLTGFFFKDSLFIDWRINILPGGKYRKPLLRKLQSLFYTNVEDESSALQYSLLIFNS